MSLSYAVIVKKYFCVFRNACFNNRWCNFSKRSNSLFVFFSMHYLVHSNDCRVGLSSEQTTILAFNALLFLCCVPSLTHTDMHIILPPPCRSNNNNNKTALQIGNLLALVSGFERKYNIELGKGKKEKIAE